MVQGLLGCLRPLLVAAAVIGDGGERAPDPCQSEVVFCLLEERQRRPREPLEFVDRRVVCEKGAEVGGDDEGECLPDLVVGLASPLGGPIGKRCLPRHRLGDRERELKVDIEPQRPGQLERPLEQRGGRPIIASERARRPAAARCSLACSVSPGSGCPSSAL